MIPPAIRRPHSTGAGMRARIGARRPIVRSVRAIASAVIPYGGKLAGRYDLGMLCVMAGSPNGYDALDYNWQLANAEAAAQGRVMDRANFRIMAPFHIAETREKAIENVRAGFEKWQLYSYSVNPEGGAAIGMPSIEEINAGGRGAIGTPDDALRVLENYWAKTSGFGCILLLAHDWADWEATKRSYELFARYVLPRFEERSLWRSQSMDWMRANREAFSAKRKAAAASAVERHLAKDADGAPRRIGVGPYPGSVFYASTGIFDVTHTCNTWTAEALRAAGVPVSSVGVVYSSQLLDQLRCAGALGAKL